MSTDIHNNKEIIPDLFNCYWRKLDNKKKLFPVNPLPTLKIVEIYCFVTGTDVALV
jgi:hypothetical protein